MRRQQVAPGAHEQLSIETRGAAKMSRIRGWIIRRGSYFFMTRTVVRFRDAVLYL